MLISADPNDVICCLLLSRVITEPNFNSIPGAEIKTYGGAYPSPHRAIYAQCTIDLDSDVLHDLVAFVQFKKREKHSWKSVTFGKSNLQLY